MLNTTPQGNANQNNKKTLLYRHQDGCNQNQTIASAGNEMEELEPCALLEGMLHGQWLWNTVWQFLKKAKRGITTWPGHSTLSSRELN
jgi:hypothetical protein